MRSVDPRNLCVGVKHYIVHMYSMPYYTYGSTANFLFLGPTAFIKKLYQKNDAVIHNDAQRGFRNVKIERVSRYIVTAIFLRVNSYVRMYAYLY